MGSFTRRDLLIKELGDLPKAEVADDEEVLHFVSRESLFGLGIGYIDAHLLAGRSAHAGHVALDARQTSKGDCF